MANAAQIPPSISWYAASMLAATDMDRGHGNMQHLERQKTLLRSDGESTMAEDMATGHADRLLTMLRRNLTAGGSDVAAAMVSEPPSPWQIVES